MKKWLFGVLCLALANTAWAQNPVAVPTAPAAGPSLGAPVATLPQAQNIQQASHGRGAGCESGQCSVPLKDVCVPEPATKIKVSVQYSSIDQKVCYPLCSLFGKCNSCEKGCGQPGYNCGSPYAKRVLVKKFIEEEQPYNKCTAITVPACEANRLTSPALRGTPIYMQPGTGGAEQIPVAPTKK